jgi:tetratricopeptide (TPR) repeat protein
MVLYLIYFMFVLHPYDPQEPDGASKRAAERFMLMLRKGRALAEEGKLAPAYEIVKKLRADAPSDIEVLRLNAEVCHKLGQYKEEAAVWEEFMVKAPLPVEACPGICIAYRLAGDRSKFYDSAQRCLALNDRDPDALLFVAMFHEHQGNHAEARRLLDRAVVVSPEYMDLVIARARVGVRLGEHAQARKLIDGVLSRRPEDPDALLVAALASLAGGDRTRARDYVEHAISLRPEDPDLLALQRSLGRPRRKPA